MRGFITVVFTFLYLSANAQVGFGITAEYNLYHRYMNPFIPNDTLHRSAGQVSSLLPGIGPRIWLGNQNFALTLEGKVNLKLYTVNIKFRDFQGLGSISFPITGKLNIKGKYLERPGEHLNFYLGGGLQWTRTEFLFRPKAYRNIQRPFFQTYVVEAGVGIGPLGINRGVFIRYGWGEKSSSVFHFGLTYNIDYVFMKKQRTEEKEE